MANITFDVATYNKASLALLMNSNPLVNLANKKFKNPQRVPGNLGMTIDFDEPPTVDFVPSLAFGTFRDFTQKKVTLTVDKEYAVPLGVPELEYLFNLEQNGYMTPLSKASIATLSTNLGKDMAQEILDHTFMTYGDGTANTLNSYQQLDQAIENYIDVGNPVGDELVCVLPNTAVPQIIGNGLSQFAPMRNNEIANSWDIGEFAGVKFYKSNLLPTHIAGAVGVGGLALTVVSISADGQTLTCSVAGLTSDTTNAIKQNDILTFDSGNLRMTTYYGQATTSQAVQVRATANVNSVDVGGTQQVVIPLDRPLISTPGRDQNISEAITSGMTLTPLGSHKVGVLFAKMAFMLAMPMLSDTRPYEGSTATDPMSDASMRTYFGYFPGQAQKGYVHDMVAGMRLVDRYAMRLAFPINSGA